MHSAAEKTVHTEEHAIFEKNVGRNLEKTAGLHSVGNILENPEGTLKTSKSDSGKNYLKRFLKKNQQKSQQKNRNKLLE